MSALYRSPQKFMEKSQANEPYKPPLSDSADAGGIAAHSLRIPIFGRLLIGVLLFLATIEACGVVIFGWLFVFGPPSQRLVALKPMLIGCGGVLLFSLLAFALRRYYAARKQAGEQAAPLNRP